MEKNKKMIPSNLNEKSNEKRNSPSEMSEAPQPILKDQKIGSKIRNSMFVFVCSFSLIQNYR